MQFCWFCHELAYDYYYLGTGPSCPDTITESNLCHIGKDLNASPNNVGPDKLASLHILICTVITVEKKLLTQTGSSRANCKDIQADLSIQCWHMN